MSTRDSNRKFPFGPGWLLFFGMIFILGFNKNSREVVKVLVERLTSESKRVNSRLEVMKSALEKKQEGK